MFFCPVKYFIIAVIHLKVLRLNANSMLILDAHQNSRTGGVQRKIRRFEIYYQIYRDCSTISPD